MATLPKISSEILGYHRMEAGENLRIGDLIIVAVRAQMVHIEKRYDMMVYNMTFPEEGQGTPSALFQDAPNEAHEEIMRAFNQYAGAQADDEKAE